MYKVSVLSFLLIIIFSACNNPKPVAKFNFNEGGIFGTYYHVAYEHPEGTNLVVEINAELKRLDMSLSTYKTESILSKVNTNRAVELDDLFINVFNKSQEISKITNGAFDPTVAPLVNAWGFGFRKKELVTPELLSSIENYVGYTKVALRNGKIIKKDPRVMLDFSAIAKGYAVDVIGNLLVQNGCSNYMVEIGGEVVAHGVNKEGRTWRIGINEPNDNEPMVPSQLQAIVSLENKALATSGNYRNFYIENGKKFAHTINPKTGYPVEHSLLSATVLADNCMTADAFATAFMVLGVEEAQKLIVELPNLEVFLIYDNGNGENQLLMTNGFERYLTKE